MADNRRTIIAAKSTGTGTSREGVYALKWNTSTSTYADANSSSTAANYWVKLTEDSGTTNAYFYDALPMGKYKFVIKDDSVSPATYTTIAYYENVFHPTLDIVNHIEDLDSTVRHDHDAIAIESSDTGRYGNTLDAALDNIAGSTWDKDSDDSLKDHLDYGTAPSSLAHTDDAIESDTGVGGTVEDVLDNHETRITALETGSASTPTGMQDYLGDLGVDIEWDAQDINGIEYAFRYLWKHTGESVPSSYSDLEHQRRELAPETSVLYRSRRYDLSSSVNTDLILYYAVAARGRADASWTWSAVQSIEVTIPNYTQEFTGVLNGLSVCTSSSSSVYALDSTDFTSDELMPTASESGGSPTANELSFYYDSHNVTITGIELQSGDSLSSDATIKYKSTTSGTSGNFTVSSSTKRGNTGDISLPVTAGDILQIWSTSPNGIGHYKIKIWFTRG